MAVRKEILDDIRKKGRQIRQSVATRKAMKDAKRRYSTPSGNGDLKEDIGKPKSAGAGGGKKTRMTR